MVAVTQVLTAPVQNFLSVDSKVERRLRDGARVASNSCHMIISEVSTCRRSISLAVSSKLPGDSAPICESLAVASVRESSGSRLTFREMSWLFALLQTVSAQSSLEDVPLPPGAGGREASGGT